MFFFFNDMQHRPRDMAELEQNYAHMDSYDATFEYSKCYYRGGLKYFGHTILEGAGFLGW